MQGKQKPAAKPNHSQPIPDTDTGKAAQENPSQDSTQDRGPTPPKPAMPRKDDNVVFVGKKPAMSYVMAVVTQFSEGAGKVELKARGRSISRAVDVAEVVRNRFVQGARYDVELGTEQVRDEQGNAINVSTITIGLTK